MITRVPSVALCFAMACLVSLQAHAGKGEYFAAVQSEVHRWATINRLDQGRLNRDKHSDCILSATLATTVNADGSLEHVFVAKSSGLPILDKYFTYATQQASRLFPPMTDYFKGSPPAQLTMDLQYILDTRDEQGRRAKPSTRICEPISPPTFAALSNAQ